jgi:hypothetical protein
MSGQGNRRCFSRKSMCKLIKPEVEYTGLQNPLRPAHWRRPNRMPNGAIRDAPASFSVVPWVLLTSLGRVCNLPSLGVEMSDQCHVHDNNRRPDRLQWSLK